MVLTNTYSGKGRKFNVGTSTISEFLFLNSLIVIKDNDWTIPETVLSKSLITGESPFLLFLRFGINEILYYIMSTL